MGELFLRGEKTYFFHKSVVRGTTHEHKWPEEDVESQGLSD